VRFPSVWHKLPFLRSSLQLVHGTWMQNMPKRDAVAQTPEVAHMSIGVVHVTHPLVPQLFLRGVLGA